VAPPAATPTATPTATPAPPSGQSDLTLSEPDGGTNYFDRFAKHGKMGAPGYYPLWLWGQYDMTNANIAKDKGLGFNGYYGLANPEPDANLAGIDAAGMVAVLQDKFWNASGDKPATVGWLLEDEVDMCNSPCPENGFNYRENELNNVPKDGRFRFANYSKGVGFWWWNPAARFVNGTPGMPYQDAVSLDHYWFNDPDLRDTHQGQCFYNGCGVGGNLTVDQTQRAYNYALTVQRLRNVDGQDGKRQPVFGQIEMGWPTTQGTRLIQPAEMHAALWQSIIAGARGVVYFPFSWAGPCGVTHHIQRDTSGCYTAIQNQARADNALATQLAPVINGSSVATGWSISSGNNAMVKWHDGHLYVFAGNKDNQAKSGTVSIPCVGDATAVKLGETTGSQTIPVQGGSFSDSFADGNAIHIYRIDGGSTCGLPTT